MIPKRGGIYWVAFPARDPRGSEIEKTRPCIVLSLDSVNEVRRTIIVVPLTTSAKPVPPIALLMLSAGKNSVAVCDQFQVVDKRRVRNQIGNVSFGDLHKVESSVRFLLGL